MSNQGFQKGHKPFKGIEKTQFKKGSIPKNKGKFKKGKCLICKKEIHLSINKKYCSRKCYAKARKGKERRFNVLRGKQHPNWKGGKYRNKRSMETIKYKKWRMKVFLRDNFTCVNCGKVGGYLEAHHIKSWIEFPKLRYKIDNGVTLCRECHNLI